MTTAKPPAQPQPWLELATIVERDGHWTLRKLGAAAGLSHEYVRLLLNGRQKPGNTAIRKLADALKVPFSVLEPSPRDGDESRCVAHGKNPAGAIAGDPS